MAFTTTTLSAAMVVSDRSATVASTTGFLAGQMVRIDGEMCRVAGTPPSTTVVNLLRGQDGTTTSAHPKTANVITGLTSDFAQPPAGVNLSVVNPATPAFPLFSYTAAGAITPVQGIHVLNATTTLAMTLANPTNDQDGQIIILISNGKGAHTIDLPDATGFNNAGSSYDTLSFQTGGQIATIVIACNGAWVVPSFPAWSGTVTALIGAIA
jgi:hypothetical protein